MSTASVTRNEMRMSGARSLLMDRMQVLLLRTCRSVGAVWTRWRQQSRRNAPATRSGLLAAMMGRALAAKGVHGRLLTVEERLTLGPKQHMYVIRCGTQRLLVASAGEAALQWMALPGENESRPAEVASMVEPNVSVTRTRTNRRSPASQANAKRAKRGAERAR